MHTVLLTGATGYIGRRLEKVLREREDLRLRLFVRNTRKLTEKTRQHAEVIEGDSFRPDTLRQALLGVDTAIYMIHSMGAERDFSQLDRESADNFYNACLEQGVKKIVYLGGLGLRDSASPHLASRLETGDILSSRPDRIRTIWLRAGVIIGSGSTSFEIIRHLVEKLPVMTTPRWVKTMTQPIGIDDVVAYLNAAINLDPPDNLVVDLGVPPISFKEMLQQTAEVMHLRRWIIPVPLLTTKLSSYWLTIMTPTPYRIGAALVEGLKSETLVQNDHAQQFFPQIQPQPFRETVQQALDELENDLVISRWCDSSGGAVCDISDAASPTESIYRDVRTVPLQGIPAEHVFAAIASLGGKTGWFSHSLLWQTRGLIDKAVGGYGLNRGRRMHGDLRVGDALDFWKVVDIVPGKRLLLLAQMRIPGKAWLEFDLQKDTLVQTAHFIPHGLFGRLYWYAVVPFHYFVFPALSKNILARAEKLAQGSRQADVDQG